MYDLGWDVADRTKRLHDLADGIRRERQVRDGPTDELAATVAETVDTTALTTPTNAPAAAATIPDCRTADGARHPRAA